MVPPYEGVGGPALQRTFAAAIVAVAVLVIVRNLKLETRQTPGAHAAASNVERRSSIFGLLTFDCRRSGARTLLVIDPDWSFEGRRVDAMNRKISAAGQ